FRVLRKIAMGARRGNMLDDARTLHRLALLQFDLKGGVAAGGHRNLFHHPSTSCGPIRRSRTNAETEPARDWRVPGHEGFIADQLAGAKARQLIRFRKNNSAAC